ncbi:MAG TPA: fibronectin type III domain-containing protein [Candidatus Limnocylindrales bacterium]|nr:fibronectin type III domain-containing protein [Candidatus Limnocylindrales bacterium]
MPHLLARFIIAVALVLPALAVAPATPGNEPAVGSSGPSCTGWTSITEPPATIRVGRSSGAVETVNFRTYVGRVMAKEWNIRPAAALEAAAVAVKQYAWYYALAGNWRKSYVNANGKCYDVKDTTADQIYRHDVIVAARIWDAVDATWPISVRKSGNFFLTTYRAGQDVRCGADAIGTRLFAKSVIDCANRGMSRAEIQHVYYSPGLTIHGDGGATAAESGSLSANIGVPNVQLLAGTALGSAHARISWDPNNRRPSGTTYQLQRIVSGSWSNVSLSSGGQTSIQLRLKPGTKQGFRVRLRDSRGNVGQWFSTGTFTPRLVQDANSSLSWSGDWSRVSTSNASGGTVRRSSQPGSSVTMTFTGKSIALIGTEGPRFGTARVFVNGTLEAEIELYAGSNRWRRLLFTRTWDTAATRTIRVEVSGEKGAGQVDIDAFLIHP